MPERSTVSQGVQFGVESVPGTAVAADKLFNSLTVSPGEKVDMQDFRPTGQKYSSIVVPGKEWVEFGIEGIGDYTEIIYALSSILSTASVGTVDTSAKEWTYSPASRGADVTKTFTIEQGDANKAHKFTYGLFTSLEMEFSRDGVKLGGSGIGQALADNITLTASPTALTQKPMLPTHIDVFLDDTSGALGTTKYVRVLNAKLTIGDRFNPIWALNSTIGSFVAHVESVPTVEIELLLEADSVAMLLLGTLRAGATKFLRLKANSGTDLAGAATLPYLFQFDMAGKISDVSDFSDEDGVYAITWTMKAVHDAGWTKAMSVLVRNKQAAL